MTRSGIGRWRRVGITLALVVGVTACEGAIETNVETLLGDGVTVTSRTLKQEARAHSAAMCAARAVSPTPDPEAVYGPGAVELVDSEPLDPALEPPQDDHAATSAIWTRWRDDPAFDAGPWRWKAAGEARCDDGRLYMTLVLLPSQATGSIGLVARGTSNLGGANLSGNGRWVVFSGPGNLLPGGTYGWSQIYLWDRTTGGLRRLTDGNGYSYAPSISADGSVVAFTSEANDLAPGDGNLFGADIFVWVRATGWIARVTGGDSLSELSTVSADGTTVAFASFSSNLVPGDLNGRSDVFVWDRATRTSTRLTDGDDHSRAPAISGDGSVVAFQSSATDLVAGDTNGVADVFVLDRSTGTVRAAAHGDQASDAPVISADGRYVAWHSFASDIVPGDVGGHRDVFRWDSVTGQVESITHGGSSASFIGDITPDGGVVSISSYATNLVPGDANDAVDVLLWDAASDTFTRVTDGRWDSSGGSVSDDGTRVAFPSAADDLVVPDENGQSDIYIWTKAP